MEVLFDFDGDINASFIFLGFICYEQFSRPKIMGRTNPKIVHYYRVFMDIIFG